MEIKKLSLSLCACLATYVPAALADCNDETCVSVYIEAISSETAELSTNHNVAVKTSGTETALSCTPEGGAWLTLIGGKDGSKEVYALILTAFSMDRPVTIRVARGSSGCHIAYAVVAR